jgi:LysM repeat protein
MQYKPIYREYRRRGAPGARAGKRLAVLMIVVAGLALVGAGLGRGIAAPLPGAAEPAAVVNGATPTVVDPIADRLTVAAELSRAAPTPAVPSAPVGAPARESTSWETYVVQEGDTLTEIARLGGTSVELLAERNALTDPNHIEAGGAILVPGRRGNR